ncbi:MAG: hypothetical protein EXR98_07215 [Gemmataceae bacterium]|nr:hypothetical protein [Gemmataceae bacterium]
MLYPLSYGGKNVIFSEFIAIFQFIEKPQFILFTTVCTANTMKMQQKVAAGGLRPPAATPP